MFWSETLTAMETDIDHIVSSFQSLSEMKFPDFDDLQYLLLKQCQTVESCGYVNCHNFLN